VQTTSAAVSVTVNSGVAQAYYIHSDQLDTPRVITDTSGNVVWQWDNSDPFGNNVPNENPSGQGTFKFPLRFPGQYADKETNTHYNINRDYDPSIGRYIQSDPIGLGGGINTYEYVEGDPLNAFDADGLVKIGPNVPLGVPISEQIMYIASSMEMCLGNGEVTITATTNFHKEGPHSRGMGVDIAIPGGKENAEHATCCALKYTSKHAYVQDEYHYPSTGSSGGHIHIQLTPGIGRATGTGSKPKPHCNSSGCGAPTPSYNPAPPTWKVE
jgi:RHS repeat-associated protein